MRDPDAHKWPEVHHQDSADRQCGERSVIVKDGEKVLGQVAHHAYRAKDPAQRNQVAPEDDPLPKAILLHRLAQHHVVQHRHPQALIGADLFVHFDGESG